MCSLFFNLVYMKPRVSFGHSMGQLWPSIQNVEEETTILTVLNCWHGFWQSYPNKIRMKPKANRLVKFLKDV